MIPPALCCDSPAGRYWCKLEGLCLFVHQEVSEWVSEKEFAQITCKVRRWRKSGDKNTKGKNMKTNPTQCLKEEGFESVPAFDQVRLQLLIVQWGQHGYLLWSTEMIIKENNWRDIQKMMNHTTWKSVDSLWCNGCSQHWGCLESGLKTKEIHIYYILMLILENNPHSWSLSCMWYS